VIEFALFYLARRWSVIPLRPRDKRPLLDWQKYQDQQATEEEIREWWNRWPDANIGLVTGTVSGLVVLDLDDPEAVKLVKQQGVPPTVVASTGKGWHIYFQHPGQPVVNAVALGGVKGLDVRADGGYVVAPPSVHPSGRQYTWAKGRSPDDIQLAPCPEWLPELLANRNQVATSPEPRRESGWVEQLLAGVLEGQRDDACTRLAGHFLGKGLPEREVLALLLAWNARNQPPLPESQVEKCVRSVASRESRKPARGKVFQPGGFRLDGPVYAPEAWQTLVICRDWREARELAAAGNAVVVMRRDGNLPPEADKLVAVAQEIKTAGFTPEEALRLAWELYPLRLVSRAATEGTAALTVAHSHRATEVINTLHEIPGGGMWATVASAPRPASAAAKIAPAPEPGQEMKLADPDLAAALAETERELAAMGDGEETEERAPAAGPGRPGPLAKVMRITDPGRCRCTRGIPPGACWRCDLYPWPDVCGPRVKAGREH